MLLADVDIQQIVAVSLVVELQSHPIIQSQIRYTHPVTSPQDEAGTMTSTVETQSFLYHQTQQTQAMLRE